MNKIREFRIKKGLTLKALGELCSLSVPFLSEMERGICRPSITSVAKVAKVLDSTLSEVLRDADEFYINNPKTK